MFISCYYVEVCAFLIYSSFIIDWDWNMKQAFLFPSAKQQRKQLHLPSLYMFYWRFLRCVYVTIIYAVKEKGTNIDKVLCF